MSRKLEQYEKILQSREDRSNKQQELLKAYPYTLISFTLNTPGLEKRNDLYEKIHKDGLKAIIDNLYNKGIEMKYREESDKETGPEAYLLVDYDAILTKKMMIKIEEEHFLGRVFDIDVFDSNHYQVSRSDLLYDSRRCLLCEDKTYVCMRKKRHSYEELINAIRNLGDAYFN